MFNKCSKNVLIELCRISVRHFMVLIFGLFTKSPHFLRFVLHTIPDTASCWVFVAEVVLVKCL